MSEKRNILLVEPNYKTKFPPLGLMKISAYHKELGDHVKFVKGIDQQIPYDRYWHRVYVSTVFTYHWKVTVQTIRHYKAIVKDDSSRIFVGGIMATLMAEELWKETGIVPIRGTMSKPGILDDNDLIVDEMIPDYELFDDSPQSYSLVDDSYFGYSTRGCIRKDCDFCGVRTLEPKFIDYKGLKPYVESIKERYGEKRNIVLFDNNILASKRLERIVNDLLDLGFEKGAVYTYKGKVGQTVRMQRHVDFNQGVDARLMTKSKVKLISQLALHPLRIAFDHIRDKDKYEEKVRLAHRCRVKHFSNYVLYNYNDTPEDLWRRLKINIDLNQELGLQIYSFPMKYVPLNAKDRTHIDAPRWNWQFLRGVQRILNVMKGPVMPEESYFCRAFGEDEEAFIEILHMPEALLMSRGTEPGPEENAWRNAFRRLTSNERSILLEALCDGRTKAGLRQSYSRTRNRKIKAILEYYVTDDMRQENLPLFDS